MAAAARPAPTPDSCCARFARGCGWRGRRTRRRRAAAAAREQERAAEPSPFATSLSPPGCRGARRGRCAYGHEKGSSRRTRERPAPEHPACPLRRSRSPHQAAQRAHAQPGPDGHRPTGPPESAQPRKRDRERGHRTDPNVGTNPHGLSRTVSPITPIRNTHLGQRRSSLDGRLGRGLPAAAVRPPSALAPAVLSWRYAYPVRPDSSPRARAHGEGA